MNKLRVVCSHLLRNHTSYRWYVQDNIRIGAGYVEVWVTKALKQWIMAQGGEQLHSAAAARQQLLQPAMQRLPLMDVVSNI
jgi:hypothetical protein